MSVFVFVIKEGFDLPGLPQDYKDEIETSEPVEFNPDDGKQPKTFGLNNF